MLLILELQQNKFKQIYLELLTEAAALLEKDLVDRLIDSEVLTV